MLYRILASLTQKEMNELIEAVKDYAAEYGIIDHEIQMLEEAYR